MRVTCHSSTAYGSGQWRCDRRHGCGTVMYMLRTVTVSLGMWTSSVTKYSHIKKEKRRKYVPISDADNH